MSYTELSIEERATIQVGQYKKLRQREIARMLGRSPSIISRELPRNRLVAGYSAHDAQAFTRNRRVVCRPIKKLISGNERFELVIHLLQERFSPDQIAGKLRLMKMNFEEAYVCRETIYNDFCRSGCAALNSMPMVVRKSMTYDQGREMAKHAQITQRTGVAIYFCDPHSPWQRGSNENINGLIRQYLPKGTDLSVHSQEALDAISYQMNIRPRKCFGYKCPIEVITEVMGMHHAAPCFNSIAVLHSASATAHSIFCLPPLQSQTH